MFTLHAQKQVDGEQGVITAPWKLAAKLSLAFTLPKFFPETASVREQKRSYLAFNPALFSALSRIAAEVARMRAACQARCAVRD